MTIQNATIRIGDMLPEAKLMTPTEKGPAPLSTNEIFGGRTVALFALPGAYTPTCSAKHMPGFLALAGDLKARGVDTIACLSVNDAFVMGAWARDQKVEDRVLMLADGNGDFTRALGLELDLSGFGMGLRSRRYAMIVRDGRVAWLGVEDNPSLVEVSSADTLIGNL
ncbi:peroxiredoxin [Zavarzinia compransoris]|uniref:peroxiredoxin n=1 Tax=Zavarzinia marina TaxID=2911065 RepID=UPI001F2D2C98|nr:peroxiredoxin [Zavarzinia marina]MCF4164717.1 peroxiredoxin [Zavarzinia marina]